ncbi:hypothetical protein WUBG_02357 [Wuchereria bancrofti]|uniref:Uncharacterized protein n=1 Tax=Wuchereria bancrofti TaxID=6293 RepID=J9FAY2_WUCBA|nr:hypothetical protein WUBG_02357 [Wuchereria bancrofti]VDM20339.1 unnamed protein product [Wuchereria bancrofti]
MIGVAYRGNCVSCSAIGVVTSPIHAQASRAQWTEITSMRISKVDRDISVVLGCEHICKTIILNLSEAIYYFNIVIIYYLFSSFVTRYSSSLSTINFLHSYHNIAYYYKEHSVALQINSKTNGSDVKKI